MDRLKFQRQIFLTVVLLLVFASNAFAGGTPVATDNFFVVYDILVNDIVQGPPGIAVAVGGIGFGALQLFRNAILPAAGALIGAALIFGAPTIATQVGAVII